MQNALAIGQLVYELTYEQGMSPGGVAAEVKKTFGVTMIGFGAFRAVIDMGETIVKVAMREDYRDANLQEINLWTEATPAVQRVLCPIVDSCPNGSWLEMPKARVLDGPYQESEIAEDHPGMIKMRRIMWDLGYDDVEARNVGVINGNQLVLIDYGMSDTKVTSLTPERLRTLGEDGMYVDTYKCNRCDDTEMHWHFNPKGGDS